MAQGKLKLPPALKKGDTIGIMAPSSLTNEPVLRRAAAYLEKLGYKVFIHPQTFLVNGQSAGTEQQKIDALHDLYRDPAIKAIFTAKGGNQATAILDKIDYKLIARHPKILIGYSDVTSLLHAIGKKSKIVTFHGPMAQSFAKPFNAEQLKQCFNLLGGKKADIPLTQATIIHPGKAEGPLAGGNLSLICSLLGTPYQPDFKGAILFLEDCCEEYSRIDRMLVQLRNAGILKQISGLVLGGFTGLTDTGKHPYGKTVAEMVTTLTVGLNIPVLMDAPFGHGDDLYTLPVGAQARLQAASSKSSLRLGPSVI